MISFFSKGRKGEQNQGRVHRLNKVYHVQEKVEIFVPCEKAWKTGAVGAVNIEGRPIEIIVGTDSLTFGSHFELGEIRSPAVHVSFSTSDINQFTETIFGI